MTIYIIDDEPEVTEALAWLIKSVGYQVETFNHAEAFLKHECCEALKIRPKKHCSIKQDELSQKTVDSAVDDIGDTSCLILDVRMRHISGFALQKVLTQEKIYIPTIFISGHADVGMAVEAMKLGAVDFLTKPVNNQQLLEAINQAIQLDRKNRQFLMQLNKNLDLIDTLTSREKEVFYLMAAGQSAKHIARELDISTNTAELHRSNVMRKMQVRTVVELVRLGHIYRLIDVECSSCIGCNMEYISIL